MADVTIWAGVRPAAVPLDRRSGADRRSGQDRRAVNLWRETGRLGLELRAGTDRRCGADRRGERRDPARKVPDFVTPWQIPETRESSG
jgi:hypothetical protein